MSETSGTPRDELLEETKDSYEQKRQKQDEALREIATEDDFKRTTTVQLGGLDLEVTKWWSDEDIELIGEFEELPDDQDDLTQDHINTILSNDTELIRLLASLTTSETYNREFWERYYEEYGPVGSYIALMMVIEPGFENMEEHGEALGNLQERVEAKQ